MTDEREPLSTAQRKRRLFACFVIGAVMSGFLISLALGPALSWREWPLVAWVLFLVILSFGLLKEAMEHPDQRKETK